MTKEQLFIQLVGQLSSKGLFFGHAVIDAEDEAMMVMMGIFNQDLNQILSCGSESVNMNEKDRAQEWISQRLQTKKPMAYIIGKVSFCGLNFLIDERALVPRSPLAELIQNDFKPWKGISDVTTVLDLCTGSGCIGLSIAHYNKNTRVDLSDVSKCALELAKDNIELHDLTDRVTTIESDLFDQIEIKYDLIVSNPPYVSDEEYCDLPQEYKQEPKLGLVTPQQGLRIPVQILAQSPDYLHESGLLILEVGYSDDALDDAFPEIQFEWIDFLNGGQGVCVFSREKLLEYRCYFKAFLEEDYVV